jgi:hypothetical protein
MSVISSSYLRTPAASTDLGQAVHELVVHQIDLDQFARQFLVSRVYTLCPVLPGLFVMSRPDGAAIVPVWSTVRALRQVLGGYDWFACLGRDLVVHLPSGVDVLIDDGLPRPIALPYAVLSAAEMMDQ